ncbi:ATP synthase F1 subunit gamma [Persicirhabdus sediminis]|uniref:ATP synthase gamma chain n=1 Tax=Persicirhabdus sediminis TaxID=454144 RepID=A0A8J7MFT5_9BACT|nr:ATP synthase F1 subunit gamma [Persicirhabdus sediminis]MBK1792237.1 ATP synthase F1 subunit gamma [Persicirhabdus sediminis]
MANLRDIRRRIKSVKNTAQITKAMQLVASAKMKKAQDQAISGRDYAISLNKVLANLKSGDDELVHPLMDVREEGKHLVLVISTDRGLCGGLNANLQRKVTDIANAEGDNVDFVTIGRKLRQQLAKRQVNLVADFTVDDPVPFADSRPVAKFLTEQFLSGKYNKVTIAFNRFVTTMSQEPTLSKFLPIEAETLAERRAYESVGKRGVIKETDKEEALSNDYIFEPGPDNVLNHLLPLYLGFHVYQTLVESRASEHSARMVAMKAATDNANTMIDELTLEYNKARQAAITAELLEITTAMKAME